MVAAGQSIVPTESGRVQSVASCPGVEVFRGIPYAAPPVGPLRWRAPQPVAPWDSVRLCAHWPNTPYQLSPDIHTRFYAVEYHDTVPALISEDCLALNVWVPAGERSNLPVMVWLHGGAFWTGRSFSAEFWPDSLVKRQVIVVTVGYRLGVAGFFAHPDLAKEAGTPGSGNYGLMDQIAALRWVRRNITAFGGDTARITLFGESAGAGAVQLLIGSPMARGLFSRAIMQSGGGYRNVIFPVGKRWSQGFGRGLMRYAKCPDLDSLRRMPMRRLDRITLRYFTHRLKIPFLWPTIDGVVLTESPWHATQRGHDMPIPTLVGYTKNDLFGPIMKRAARKWGKIKAQQGQPVWVYSFDRDLPGHMGKKPGNSGAPHTAELRYVFGTLSSSWRPWRKADWDLSHQIITYWTNFAKTGNPNLPDTTAPQWLPYTGNHTIMHLDAK